MKIPRDLTGETLVNRLCRDWGYRTVRQEGSHIVILTGAPSHQRVVVPAHKRLRIGTLNAILRAVARHKRVERSDLLK